MLRAVYIRTLKPGTTDEQFIEAWMPEHHTRMTYPASVTIARSSADPRQVLSVFDIDVDPAGFADMLPDLIHPDAESRLDAIVDSTQFADVFVIADRFGTTAD